jgi:hypothetical protein
LIDLAAARQASGTDSAELDVSVLQHYLPIRLEGYREFAARQEKFLLYTIPGHGEWWPARLLDDGYALDTLATDGSWTLYLVGRPVNGK